MKWKPLPVGVATAVAVIALGQGVNLAWKPKLGATQTYALRMEFTLFGDVAVYTARVHEKIAEVGDQKVVVETTQTDYKVTIFGDEGAINDKDMPKAQTVFDAKGNVVEVRGDLVNDAAYRMANLSAFRRPDKPVAVGDTWTATVKADAKTGVLDAKATYKVDAEERVKDVPALVISFEYAESGGIEPARSVGKLWLSKADGAILKSEATWSSAPIPGAPSPVNGTVSLERVDASL